MICVLHMEGQLLHIAASKLNYESDIKKRTFSVADTELS